MNSLVNYGSDGENSNDSNDAKGSSPLIKSSIPTRRASDAIYDPVPMDMSEESNNNNSSDDSESERSPNRPRASVPQRTDSRKNSSSYSDQRRIDNEERSSNSRDGHKHNDKTDESNIDKREKSSRRDDKKRDHKDSKDLKRCKDDDKKTREDDKKSRESERKSRDSERKKEKFSKDDKNDKIDEKNERDHHRDDRRDRDRKDDRDRRRDRDRDRARDRSRDRDRDRRYSKDEKSRDRHRDDRRSRDRDRVRSRSRSRDRVPSHRSFNYREDRSKNKLAQLEKLGIEIKSDESLTTVNQQTFYNPLATATQGKYAEQIQKRKLLWQNKKQEDNKSTTAPSTASTWVGTTFTHDQDGKVTAKFKRLMGIKEDLPATQASSAKPEILKKQEEMFNNMEQQYEVARATTHTQRGVGLGYASGSFPFPR